jgi:16S rRNA G1207 methylase RsmC
MSATISTSERGAGRLEGLNADDPGVRLLAEVARTIEPELLLLVHCGDLPGLRPGATRLILDVRERTGSPHSLIPDLGRAHASAPLPFELGETAARFAAAMVWPRAHLGKDFSEACLAIGALGLREGGRLYCAVRKQKGGKSLGRTMRALLGEEVEVIARDRGYHLWTGVRGSDFDRELAEQLSTVSYEIRDPALGELVLDSRPGVFSRRELDGGTRALLAVADALAARELAPTRVLDLCAGIGPLALWAASRWQAQPSLRVLAVESNLRACALLRANAQRNGLGAHVQVCEHDGLPRPSTSEGTIGEGAFDEGAFDEGTFAPVDLVLLNPPTHADADTLQRLFDVRAWLRPGGRLLLVVNRPELAVRVLAELGAEIDGGERDGYFVIQARWRARDGSRAT